VAQLSAAERGEGLPQPADFERGAREASRTRLGELAALLTERRGWETLVLPEAQREQLRSVSSHLRHRDMVLLEWGYEQAAASHGIKVLFAGPSGTGKTMAAQVIATDLGLDVFRVDLATVVSKYIGETERNLDRIFGAAEGSNAILFFDEADALFGKRSEVKDAQDKYANVEVAYLLQRLEDFDGVAVLASNLRGNLDDAFKRRIDVLVDFPLPDAGARELLWRTCLGPEVALAPDVDLQALAAFDLAGGDIRNVAVGAAMAAAEDAGPVTMRHLVRAVQTEYRKLGRLSDTAMFADLQEFLTLDAPAVAGKRQPARAAKPSA
jgi:SpoVK/Ycf46/Vps4 family AAA+-type ATPase